MNEYIKSSKATQNTNASILAGYDDNKDEVTEPVEKKLRVKVKKATNDVQESPQDNLKDLQVFSNSDGLNFDNCTINIKIDNSGKWTSFFTDLLTTLYFSFREKMFFHSFSALTIPKLWRKWLFSASSEENSLFPSLEVEKSHFLHGFGIVSAKNQLKNIFCL